MKKLYLDRTDNPCLSLFVKDAEIIPAGVTIYSMPVKDKNAEYDSLTDAYDIHFIFEDNIPAIDFYAIPHIDIMAVDSSGGYFGTLGEVSSLDSKAPICYIDHDKNCYTIASDFRDFLNHLSMWKKNAVPCEDVALFDTKEDAMESHEFISASNEPNAVPARA